MLSNQLVAATPEMNSLPENRTLMSDLPPDVLGRILSFDPTKRAFANSALSKLFKSALGFTLAPSFPINIEFNDRDFFNVTRIGTLAAKTSFSSSVETVFSALAPHYTIENFTFKSRYGIEDRIVMAFIADIVSRGVKEVNLSLVMNDVSHLLGTLNNCSSLTTLTLDMNSQIDVPNSLTFPNMASMNILNAVLCSQSLKVLVDACGKLHDLSLFRCSIYGPELIIEGRGISVLVLKKNSLLRRLTIKAEVLKRLDYEENNNYTTFFLPLCGSSIQEVMIDVERYCPITKYSSTNVKLIGEIITSARMTQKLHLSEYFLQVVPLMFMHGPAFINLKYLSVGLVNERGWMALSSILHNAPNLERLDILEVKNELARFENDFTRLRFNRPTCFRLLKRVTFWAFGRNETGIALVEHFLTYGIGLEKVNLHCRPSDVSAIEKALCKHPNYSKVQLEVKLLDSLMLLENRVHQF